MGITVGLVMFDDMEELDFVGPWEVFTSAAKDSDSVLAISEQGEEVRCAKGLRMGAEVAFIGTPRLDVLVVPGGSGSRVEMKNPAMIEFVSSQARSATWIASVCTGSFILHAAGLIDAGPLTTHWQNIEELRQLGATDVRENARYVRAGQVVTAAGVSAGIDMSLWLVARSMVKIMLGLPKARSNMIRHHLMALMFESF